MVHDWQTLTKLTGGAAVLVERVRLVENAVAIEGNFELPPLAHLSAEDQVFVMAFVRCHGNIKQMEQYFGVSYPTIKNRLNRIGAQFGLVEDVPAETSPRARVLERLERGEISVEDALQELAR